MTSQVPSFFYATNAPNIRISLENRTVDEAELLLRNDASWALSCAFLILTMQTGFAMLECGNVSAKNAASIMIKNCVDVTFGGLSYWCFGYGLSFGSDYPNPFCGIGKWFFSMSQDAPGWGTEYSHYFFHFSFASTATTIVSGAVAERMNFYAYVAFSFYNVIVYCVPASWAWNAGHGWLDALGFFDFAGVCIVHYGGGVCALVAALMLGPRMGRFDNPDAYKMSSPVTAMTGMFMLWWAWMSFNAGSSFGVNQNLWKVSALAAVNTLNGGIAGGVVGILTSMLVGKGKIFVPETINSVLGGLVSITGICPVTEPTEAIVIGAVGGLIACLGQYLLNRLKIDDPVGAVPVHLMSAAWGTLAVGLFAKDITGKFDHMGGLFHTGSVHQLYVQLIGLAAVTCWSALTTAIGMVILDKIFGLRCSLQDEILGADWTHHELQTDAWRSELFDDVFDRLTDKTVDERTAGIVLGELKEQIRRIQRSAVSSPNSAKHPSTEMIDVPSRPPTPDLCSTQRNPSSRPSSRKEQLQEILKAAAEQQPSRTMVTQVTGPMMLPLYKSFVGVRPAPMASTPRPTDTFIVNKKNYKSSGLGEAPSKTPLSPKPQLRLQPAKSYVSNFGQLVHHHTKTKQDVMCA